MRSRDHFYLPASAQNSEDSEELLKAEESRSICRKQKKKVSSNFRRRKSNRIYDLLLLEHIFWLKSHPPYKLHCLRMCDTKGSVFDKMLPVDDNAINYK